MLVLSRMVGDEILIGDRMVLMVIAARNWGCTVQVRRTGPPKYIGRNADGEDVWDSGDVMTIRLGIDQAPVLLAPAIYLRCCESHRGIVRLGIDAPPTVLILRAELADQITPRHDGGTP